MDEAALLGALSHPNIVTMIGVSFDADPRLIILELCAEGALETYLERMAFNQLSALVIGASTLLGFSGAP